MKALAVAVTGLIAGASSLVVDAPSTALAAPPGDDATVAFVVRGVGNGHGRGLSQWGSFGRALAGQSWQQILDAYYGGTTAGTRSKPDLRVRLTDWDGAGTVGVISRIGQARWHGSSTGYASLYATETSRNVFSVYGVPDVHACPPSTTLVIPFVDLQQGSTGADVVNLQRFLTEFGFAPGGIDGSFGSMTKAAVERFQAAASLTVDGLWRIEEANAAQAMVNAGAGAAPWQLLASGVTGPVRFSTVGSSTAAPGDVLGVCRDGAATHYRGELELLDDSAGTNRLVNQLDVEQYLRGVVPQESPASWGDSGGGAGMNALRAQSVAARSYGLAQGRYSYAQTCDTPSCQVYGGAARRSSPTNINYFKVEHPNTDRAIADTAGVVRVWSGTNNLVSTEFSASNGPHTAGGSFPSVADPWDDQPGNPNHRWTRIIDADAVMARYGLSTANGVATRPAAGSPYTGIWANEVVLGNGSTVSAWDFRNAFGLPAPGFELIPVKRGASGVADFAFIGDSVGASVAVGDASPFQILTEGVFTGARYDAVSGRRTQGGSGVDGVGAASQVPVGTKLVVVELGYNDDPAAMAGRIDAVMSTLRGRSVGRVAWVNLSQRRSEFTATNAALAAAVSRWSELTVLDWHGASNHSIANRWFSDDVHLTSTGKAEFSLWLRDRVVEIAADGYVRPQPLAAGVPMRIPVRGMPGVPASGVAGVALNVTSVNPTADGWLRVWPCALPEPTTSTVNYVRGGVSPNAAVVPVDAAGDVCVKSVARTDVVVDLAGWFDAGLRSGVGRLYDSRDARDRLSPGEVLRVRVLDRFGVPGSGVAGVALNVTAVGPVATGWLRAWSCGLPEPGTSTVNYVRGGVSPNAALVPVDAGGEVCVVSSADTDVIVDLAGWFDAGLRSGVGRLYDSRDARDRLSPGEVLRVRVLDRFGVPGSGVAGVALNVTAVNAVASGWLRVWTCGAAEPGTSTVNYVRGGVSPNAALVPVNATGEVCVVTSADTDVVVDLAGWFDSGLREVAAVRLVDTRSGPMPR